MKIKGKVHKFGNNINTDEIIPAKYLNTTDKGELARHCMEGIDANFAKKVRQGDIIVGGRNFGCGSSREHAPQAIKAAGAGCVVAESFARIFYRNSINIGLPILESADAARHIKSGDEVELDLRSGEITDITRGEIFRAQKFPEFMQRIINAGGLMGWIRRRGKKGL